MSTLDLINAIQAGDSVGIEQQFDEAMTSRIAERLDDMRAYVAKNMFNEDIDVYDYSDIITESDIADFIQTEEFEQLDELSKKTLGSYVKKAANDMAISHANRMVKSAEADEVDRFMNRNTAAGYKEKHGVTDNLKKALGADSASVSKHMYRSVKRSKGINTAVKKLTKEDVEAFMQTEEFEQLDEISKATVLSYRDKAIESAKKAEKQANKHRKEMSTQGKYRDHWKDVKDGKIEHEWHPSYPQQHRDKAAEIGHRDADASFKKAADKYNAYNDIVKKRTAGIDRATKILTKEDIDQLEENKVPTGIKLYHKDKEGNENYSIHFSGQDAAKEEKRRKKIGHKVVAHAVMYGKEEGERVNH